MKRTFKLFGDRVLLEKVSMKQGMIHTPEIQNDISRLGRVIALGDGKGRDGRKDIKMQVEVGDTVYFQTNATMAASAAYAIGEDEMLINIPYNEIIAKVRSNSRTLEGFAVIGDWVLVRPFLRTDSTSRIIVPEIAKGSLRVYYRVEQVGDTVEIEIKKGDEVLVIAGHCNPLAIDSEDFGFALKQAILGVVEESLLVA